MTDLCDCPPDAATTLDGVTITGHKPYCGHAEPRRYVWLEDGEMTLGTLADYAQAWTMPRTAVSSRLRTWNTVHRVTVTTLGADRDGDTWARLTVDHEHTDVLVAEGKPLTRAEHAAIVDNLNVPAMDWMLAEIHAHAPRIVADAVAKIGAWTAPGARLPARELVKVLGVAYGNAPHVWLEALRTARPELLPERHRS